MNAAGIHKAEMILICGKICAGMTTYAKKLMKEKRAVRLNSDEIMLSLFDPFLGENHEAVLHKVMEYIYRKSLEIYETGISVILEGGFWQRELREEASSFYAAHGITPQWHYVDVSEEAWKRNIEMRNQQALKGEPDVYPVDENLLQKFLDPDDIPSREEMDIWYKND